MTIPPKCMTSAIYFLGGTFPSGIKCLSNAYSNKEEHTKVKKRSAWVAHLDKQKKKTKKIRLQSQKWNKKMTPKS
jgi:hypothetical protein